MLALTSMGQPEAILVLLFIVIIFDAGMLLEIARTCLQIEQPSPGRGAEPLQGVSHTVPRWIVCREQLTGARPSLWRPKLHPCPAK